MGEKYTQVLMYVDIKGTVFQLGVQELDFPDVEIDTGRDEWGSIKTIEFFRGNFSGDGKKRARPFLI